MSIDLSIQLTELKKENEKMKSEISVLKSENLELKEENDKLLELNSDIEKATELLEFCGFIVLDARLICRLCHEEYFNVNDVDKESLDIECVCLKCCKEL